MESYIKETTILIVEDSITTRTHLKKILSESKICNTIIEATNGIDAIQCIRKEKIDLIICDIMMPQMDGFRLLMILQEHPELRDIPVILLSSLNEISKKVKGLDIGAWDFITKPFEPMELIARSKAMLRIKSLQDNLKSRMDELEQLSIIDPLTGLYNKQHLFEYVEKKITNCNRNEEQLGCIILDIDNFKEINDRYGHIPADNILKEIGHLFNHMLRGCDFAARYGGDEFVIILQIKTQDSLPVVSERIRSILENHDFTKLSKELNDVKITVSLGSAVFPARGINSVEDLIVTADKRLYKAKAEGRNCSINPKLKSLN